MQAPERAGWLEAARALTVWTRRCKHLAEGIGAGVGATPAYGPSEAGHSTAERVKYRSELYGAALGSKGLDSARVQALPALTSMSQAKILREWFEITCCICVDGCICAISRCV